MATTRRRPRKASPAEGDFNPVYKLCRDAVDVTHKFDDLNDYDRVYDVKGVTVKVRARVHPATAAEMLVYEVSGVLADPETGKALLFAGRPHLIGPHLVQVMNHSAEPEDVKARIEEGFHLLAHRGRIASALHAQHAALGSAVRTGPEGPSPVDFRTPPARADRAIGVSDAGHLMLADHSKDAA